MAATTIGGWLSGLAIVAVAAAIAGWLAIALLLWIFQERLIFPADHRTLQRPPAESGYALEGVALPDGLTLHFWAAAPAADKPVILYFHGNGGIASDRADDLKRFRAAGYGIVLAEYRHYGGNPGEPSETVLIADGRAYTDWAAARWPRAPLVLWGESLGTGVAIAVAAQRPVAAVLLDAPYTSIRALASQTYWWLPVKLLLRSPFDSLARMPSVAAPVFVLQGEADEVIPVAHGRRIYAAASCQGGSLFMPGIDHPAFQNDNSGQAEAAIASFLDRVFDHKIACAPR